MKRLALARWQAWLDNSWLRTLLLALLLVATAQVLAQTLWMLLAGPQELTPPTRDMHVISAASSTTSLPLDVKTVTTWALFGQSQGVLANGQTAAPETNLKLTLLGVFAHGSDKLAGAIIATSGQDSKLYHPGDELPGGAVLKEVLPDRVLINRMGSVETLSFEKPQLGGSIAASGPPMASDASLQQQRQMAIQQLALEPVAVGSAQGYKVSDKIAKEVQSAAGLKPGDVILTVNGLPVGTEEADQAALRSFYDSGKAQVLVERGSAQMTLTYPP